MNQPLFLDVLDGSPLVPFAALLRRPESAGRGGNDSGPVRAHSVATAGSASAHPRPETMARLRRYVETYTKKTGTTTHPDRDVTDAVLLGLAHNAETLGRPLCPCRFYPDASAEVKQGKWVCPCDDMRTYKYCHCLLFTNDQGLPITEYLPENHEGRRT